MVDVVTYHNDLAGTGQNLKETIVTKANVNSRHLRQTALLSVDGKVDAQPVYLSDPANIAGDTHNVVYVATEHAASMPLTPFAAPSCEISTLGSGEIPVISGCEQLTEESGYSHARY